MNFLDFLFPKKCLGCGQKGQYFCQDCAAKIELVDKPICPVCVKPSPFGQTHPRCQTRYTIDGLTSVFAYQGVIREALKQLKYRFRFDLAEELAALIQHRIKVGSIQQLNLKKTIVVPVPLHQWRQDWRGFNQAAVLAKILAEKMGLPFYEDLLMRKRYTKPQTGLDKEGRRKNVEKAFAVSSKLKVQSSKLQIEVQKEIKSTSPNILISQYPNVVLFDDVWTTGATMKICSNLLKRAGLKKVWGLTVAR